MVSQLEEKTIKYIPVVPVAIMLGLISAVIGLIMGIIFALSFGAIIPSIPTTNEVFDTNLFRILFGIGSIVLMPVMGFAGGFIHGAIVAVLYNFLAPRIGGIKLVFKEEA
jgi:hypothetical protein